MTSSTYFIEQFGGQKLTAQADISTFFPGDNPTKHIELCQREWKWFGYHDEWTWTHLFPSSLDDFPNKWYKIEEVRGDKFTWKSLKQNFIKDFSFLLENKHLQPTTQQVHEFLEIKQPSKIVENKPNKECRQVSVEESHQSTTF